MEYRYESGGRVYVVQVEPEGDNLRVTVDGRTYGVQVTAQRAGELVLEIEGEGRTRAHVAGEAARRWVALDPAPEGGPVMLSVPQAATGRRKRGAAAGHDALEAQMPGVVRRVLVAAGDEVERGQVLLLLEAMKMEMRVTAPHTGRVEQVAVSEGQAVERGQPLIDLLSH